jgi:hypothetical protein
MCCAKWGPFPPAGYGGAAAALNRRERASYMPVIRGHTSGKSRNLLFGASGVIAFSFTLPSTHPVALQMSRRNPGRPRVVSAAVPKRAGLTAMSAAVRAAASFAATCRAAVYRIPGRPGSPARWLGVRGRGEKP